MKNRSFKARNAFSVVVYALNLTFLVYYLNPTDFYTGLHKIRRVHFNLLTEISEWEFSTFLCA